MPEMIGLQSAEGERSYFTIADPGRFSRLAAIFDRRVATSSALTPPAARDLTSTVAHANGADGDHRRVAALLDLIAAWGAAKVEPETAFFTSKCKEFDTYLVSKAAEAQLNARSAWGQDGVRGANSEIVGVVADEIAQHLLSFEAPQSTYQSLAAYAEAAVDEVIPPEVAAMRQEANLNIIYPHFERSLAIPGDCAEFGCFRGILSVKLAWFLKARAPEKHYYTFDTFHGFEIDDPGGGALGVGAFRADEFNAFRYLTKWSKALPLTPVKGDATKTAASLTKPLSFVWLDLDMGVLMDPVLKHLWPLISADTVIGVDDVGRPETPTVKPWLDDLLKSGALELVFDSEEIAPNTFIKFVRKVGSLPG